MNKPLFISIITLIFVVSASAQIEFNDSSDIQFRTGLDMNSNTITGIPSPSSSNEAAPKSYVDGFNGSQGLPSVLEFNNTANQSIEMYGNNISNLGNVTVDSSIGLTGGDIGIGTSNPSSRLEIVTNDGGGNFAFTAQNSGSSGELFQMLNANGNAVFDLRTDSGEDAVFFVRDSSGTVTTDLRGGKGRWFIGDKKGNFATDKAQLASKIQDSSYSGLFIETHSSQSEDPIEVASSGTGNGNLLSVDPQGDIGVGGSTTVKGIEIARGGSDSTPGVFVQDPTANDDWGAKFVYNDDGVNELSLITRSSGSDKVGLGIDRDNRNVRIPNGDLNISSNNIDSISLLNSGGSEVATGGDLNVTGKIVVPTGSLTFGKNPGTSWGDPEIVGIGPGDHLRLKTSGGGGQDQYVGIWDDQNNQPIARFYEEGEVKILNGNLNLSTNNIVECNKINGVDCSNLGGGGGGAENLSETLAAGNVANQTVKMQDETLSFNNYNIYSGTGIEIGNSGTSTGDGQAISLGKAASGSQDGSVAIGYNAGSSNSDDIAIGNEASASFGGTIALGDQASTGQDNAIAIGQQADADNYRSISIGYQAGKAGSEGTDSILIGNDPGGGTGGHEASGTSSIAIGDDVEATAEGAVAIGDNADAPNSYEATFGNLNGEELDVNVTGNLTVHGKGGIDEKNVRDISYSSGHTSWGSSLSDEEVNRFGAASGETIEIDRLDVQLKGGGSNSDFDVDIYDPGSATVLGSTTAGTPINDVGTASQGSDVLVRINNSVGSSVTASITVSGEVIG